MDLKNRQDNDLERSGVSLICFFDGANRRPASADFLISTYPWVAENSCSVALSGAIW